MVRVDLSGVDSSHSRITHQQFTMKIIFTVLLGFLLISQACALVGVIGSWISTKTGYEPKVTFHCPSGKKFKTEQRNIQNFVNNDDRYPGAWSFCYGHWLNQDGCSSPILKDELDDMFLVSIKFAKHVI